ncbi:phage tail tape measure protein [Candidatus Pacearchaeota archaeon]|nr:phage tail tape measure protein [Candidatus Pacearchaeota archaeon]
MSTQKASLILESKSLMGRGMKTAASQVDRFANRTTSAAKRAHSSISTLGDRVTELGRKNASFMVGLGAIGAVGFGIKKTFDLINAGLQPAEDLQKAMSGVKAVMSSMTDKAMIPQLRAQAVALAGSGDLAFFTAVQVAGAQKMLIKSGMDAQRTMKSTAATMAIAGAEEIALANAADFTTNVMASFELQARQSTDAANMLAEASRTSNTNITELAEGAAQGGTAFKKAGGSLGEFLALGGTLAGFGIKGSEFGTGIKAMTVSLAALTPKAAKALNEIGISAQDLTDQHGNMDMIKSFALIGKRLGLDRIKMEDKYGKITEESAKKALMGNAAVTRILSKIFLKYQFGKAAILAQEAALGKVQKRVEIYNKQIGLGTQGAAFDVMRDKMDNVAGSATRLSSSWNTLMITLGSPFLGAKRGVLDYLTLVTNSINALATGTYGDFNEERRRKDREEFKGYYEQVKWYNPASWLNFGAESSGVSTAPLSLEGGGSDAGQGESGGAIQSVINFLGNIEMYNESLEQEVGKLVHVPF